MRFERVLDGPRAEWTILGIGGWLMTCEECAVDSWVSKIP